MAKIKPINISALVKKYGAKYVALDKNGKVLDSSDRVDLLVKKTKDLPNVTISWIPKENARYVYHNFIFANTATVGN